jgi:hypothetical protein
VTPRARQSSTLVGMSRLTVAIALAAASPAAAQPAVANRAVAEAEARAKANDFLGAAAKYREAYAADARPELICNIGIAYFKAKTELPRAQLFLSRCSERGAGFDAKVADAVRAVLGVVETGLRSGPFATIDVVVEPPTASVAIASFAPDESFLGSRLVWLPRGSHRITATAEGYVARTVTVEAEPKEKQTIRIVLERTPAPVPPPPVEPPPPEQKPLPPPPPPEKQYREETIRHSKLPAIAATAGTALCVGLAIYAKTRAEDAAERAPFAITHDAYEDDKDRVDSWNTRMVIAGSLALVGAGATGYLWFRALNSTTQRIEITGSDRGASVSLTRRF